MKKKIIQTFYSLVITGIQVFLIIFLIEWIYRGSFSVTLIWLREYTRPFAYNFLLLFLLFGSLRMFRRKLWILLSFIVSIVLLFLALACNVKQEIRGEPVLPADLLLGAEARNMVSFFSETLFIGLVIGFILLMVLVGIFIYKASNQKQRNILQIITSIILIFSFALTINNESKDEETYLKAIAKIHNNFWDQKDTYQKNGVVASFVLNMKWLKQEVPENYSRNTIVDILDNVEVQNYEESENPNIIVIMSEAFWDPTVLKNVHYNRDPLPYFHKLQGEQTIGEVTVPVFGGSTANTEFEALTGISTQFLLYGSVPYLHYVKKPIPALPNILKGYGYDTTAIHTWHHWFYNRSDVYRNLGFERFIGLEFLENPLPDGPFFHDKTITDEILKKLNNSSGSPNFIFAVTTQNHGPYSKTEKKPYASIKVTSDKENDGLSSKSRNMLEVFSDNLVEADKELERLIFEIEKMDQKTIVVFFGDHLPLLGNDYKVYRENGFYYEDKSYEEYIKMHSTPLLIWDNFNNHKENLSIGSSMLAPIILDQAGLNGNYLTDYLFQKYRHGFVYKIPRNEFLGRENVNQNPLDEIPLLQYDVLFGKLYGMSNKKIDPNNNYRLGYSEPIIEDVSFKEVKEEELIVIKGKHFTGSSNVYINGDLVQKLSGDSDNLVVPYKGSRKDLEIIIKISDSNGKVLSESESFTFKNK